MFFRIFFFATRLGLSYHVQRTKQNDKEPDSIAPSPRQKRSFHCSPEPCIMTIIPSFDVHRHTSRSKFEDLLTHYREPAYQCRPPLCLYAATGPSGNGPIRVLRLKSCYKRSACIRGRRRDPGHPARSTTPNVYLLRYSHLRNLPALISCAMAVEPDKTRLWPL